MERTRITPKDRADVVFSCNPGSIVPPNGPCQDTAMCGMRRIDKIIGICQNVAALRRLSAVDQPPICHRPTRRGAARPGVPSAPGSRPLPTDGVHRGSFGVELTSCAAVDAL